MKRVLLIATAVVALGSVPASANEAWDVEAARANARAGGPTNALDAWHLERWGCLSGTRSAFCEQLRHRGKAHRVAKYKRAH